MHGYQANRILAFDDDGVMIHAMHKEAAARVTQRSVSELEKLGKKIVPMSSGTFPTDNGLFVALLIGVILIVGGLTFFPALALGPVVEHLAMHAGSLF